MPSPPEKTFDEIVPATVANDLAIGDIAGAIAIVVLEPKEIAILRDGIDDALPAGEDVYESFQPPWPISLHLATSNCRRRSRTIEDRHLR